MIIFDCLGQKLKHTSLQGRHSLLSLGLIILGLIFMTDVAQAQVSCPLISTSVTANATSMTCSATASSDAPSVQIVNNIGLSFNAQIIPNTGAAAPVTATCIGGGCFASPSGGTINCDSTSQPCNVSYSFPDANGDTVIGAFTAPAYGFGGATILPHIITGGVFNADSTPPPAPDRPTMTDDTGFSATDYNTTDTTPTFTGTVEPNAAVRLFFGGATIGPVMANGAGEYTIALPAQSDGSYSSQLNATDAAGNVSAPSGPWLTVIDTSTPAAAGAPDLADSSDTGVSDTDNITTDVTPTFTGTVEAGTFVALLRDGIEIATANANGSTGAYSITQNASMVGVATYKIRVSDRAGNVAADSSGITVTVESAFPTEPSSIDLQASSDTGSSDTDDITRDTTPTFTVSGVSGVSSVKLFSGSTEIGSVLSAGASVDVTATALNDGVHDIEAKAVSVGGYESLGSPVLQITVDTSPPTVTSITRGFSGPGQIPATTNLDVVSWFVKFSENVTRPTASDFSVTGTTSPVTISHVNDDEYEISLAGGDIATVNGVVTLNFAAGQTITDAVGNALVNVTPTGTNNNSFNMVNDEVPPNLQTASISSNNGNSDLAASGDIITLTITTDENLGVAPTVTIAGQAATVSGSGSSWSAAWTVSGMTPLGLVAISISNLQDSAGNITPGPFTATTDSSSVMIGQVPDSVRNLMLITLTSPVPGFAGDPHASNLTEVQFSWVNGILNGPTATVHGPLQIETFRGSSCSGQRLGSSGQALGPTESGVFINRTGASGIGPGETGSLHVIVENDYGRSAPSQCLDFVIPELDTTLPTVVSVVRKTPGAETTGADSLTWTVTFSEEVTGVSGFDFSLTGTSASATTTPINPILYSYNKTSATVYEVTASGGDLANANGTVSLNFADSQNITDRTAANRLASTIPSGANQSYQLVNDSTAPTLTSIVRDPLTGEKTNADRLTWTVTFSEAVQNLDSTDFTLSGTTAMLGVTGSGTTYEITASGGDLAGLGLGMSGQTVSLNLSNSQNIQDGVGNNLVNTTPTGVSESYQVNNNSPTVNTIARGEGSNTGSVDALTNADTLVWNLLFSSISSRFSLAPADFTLTGTTATITAVERYSVGFRVRASGGNLASLNGDVTLGFSATTPVDEFGNPFSDKTPRSVSEMTYTLDNTAPELNSIFIDKGTVSPTDADTVSFIFSYSEDLDPSSLDVSNVVVTGTTADVTLTPLAAYLARVTLSGGDLANMNGTVTVSLNANNNIIDPAGNMLASPLPQGKNDNTVVVQNDATPPRVEITSNATDFVGGAFTAFFTMSEAVTGFELDDIIVANGVATSFNATSTTFYTALITPTADGTVTIDVAGNAAQDDAGNYNTAAAQFTITNDTTAPTASTSTPPSSVNGPFDLAFIFTEDMTGLTADDFNVENGSVVLSGGPRDFVLTITPDGNGDISINLPANVATDPAGNGNEAYDAVINVIVDVTAPSLVLSTPETDVTGPFVVTAIFTEDVTGFTIDDIEVTNGTLSDFSGSASVYTVIVTPVTIGDISISVADGNAQDLTGNASTGAALNVTAGGGEVVVELEVSSTVLDSTSVGTEFSLSNPGSQVIYFSASSDQPWVDVTPGSGKIDALSNIEFDIQLNDKIDDLAPGTYVATVIVEVVDAPTASAGGTASSNTLTRNILAEVPVTVEVEERFGDFELIVLTPSGPIMNASFDYTSNIAALNGLSVLANEGERRTSLTDLMNGAYTLEQSIPEGYDLTSITCSGDLDGGTVVNLETASVLIDLDATESISCVFENTRDDDAVRIATQRAIRNFMARRGDRILEATPDLSNRFAHRQRTEGGEFSASGTDLRTNMNFETSLSGFRNRAVASETAPRKNLANPVPSKWDLWASAEYTRYDDERADSGVDGKFFAAQFGADYLVKPNLILGAMVQYDWMSEFDKEPVAGLGTQVGADVSGDGVMAGPYIVWQPKERLTIDVVGLWGRSENTVNPLGYYSDQFETNRFLVRANVTGEFATGPWRLRPQMSLSHYQDKQHDYVDSLGIDIPSQTITIGRLRAGPELVWTHQTDKGSQLEIGGSIRGVWNYNGAGLMDQSGVVSSGSTPLRADGDLSIGTRFSNGIRLRAAAGFDGIGKGDFSARSGRLEFSFPFGGKGGMSSTETTNPLGEAGFHRACEMDAYLQSFNVSVPMACHGERRANLLDTNIAMMQAR